MNRDLFPVFTEDLLKGQRCFLVYYKYSNMLYPCALRADVKKRININPMEKITPAQNCIPLHPFPAEMREWFPLLDQYIRADPDLKILIQDQHESDNIQLTAGVGMKGQWFFRLRSREAMRRIGVIADNISWVEC